MKIINILINTKYEIFRCVGRLAILSAVLLILSVIIYPVLIKSTKPRQVLCTVHLKQLLEGVSLYDQDWDSKLPPAMQWATLSSKYNYHPQSDQVWHCPSASSPYSYAFNKTLSEVALSDIYELNTTVGLFEADTPIWNATGGVQDQAKNRHPLDLYGFIDGHVNDRQVYRFKYTLK